MSADHLARCLLIALACLSQQAVAADVLHHDLFARPLLTGQAHHDKSNAPNSADQQTPWNPRLVALLVAGRESLANVDGTIVRIGEAVAGHTLMSVREGEATFSMNDQVVVLTIAPVVANGLIRRTQR